MKESLTKIKQAEKKAQDIIKKTEEESAKLITLAREKGEKDIDKVRDSALAKKEKMLAGAKKGAEKLKEEEGKKTEVEVKNLEKQALKNIDKAVELVVSKFLEAR